MMKHPRTLLLKVKILLLKVKKSYHQPLFDPLLIKVIRIHIGTCIHLVKWHILAIIKHKSIKTSMKTTSILCLILLITSCSKKNISSKQDPILSSKIKYEVIRIVDGDTYELIDTNGVKFKIRLIGVDTPETKHPRKGKEPYGPESTAFAKRHLSDKTIKLKFEIDTFDRYNRVLAHVYLKRNHFNLMLLDSGMAKTSFYKPNFEYKKVFTKAEKKAKSERIGLWGLKYYQK